MTQRKNYEAPAMEVVELKLQGSLLAGSSKDGRHFFRFALVVSGKCRTFAVL